MGVIQGYFNLTSEQRQFKKMLDQYPHFSGYWTFDSNSCSFDIEAIERDIVSMSRSDQIMLNFFSDVRMHGTELSRYLS